MLAEAVGIDPDALARHNLDRNLMGEPVVHSGYSFDFPPVETIPHVRAACPTTVVYLQDLIERMLQLFACIRGVLIQKCIVEPSSVFSSFKYLLLSYYIALDLFM